VPDWSETAAVAAVSKAATEHGRAENGAR